jgi:hypothetical protein
VYGAPTMVNSSLKVSRGRRSWQGWGSLAPLNSSWALSMQRVRHGAIAPLYSWTLLTKAKASWSGSRRRGNQGAWWSPQHNSWRQVSDDIGWLRDRTDLPNIERMVQLADPKNGGHWVTLEGFYEWEEPIPVDREWGEIPHRMIWYQLRSYIVQKQHLQEVLQWATQKNFMGRWMPESHELHYVFLGEFFRSPAFREESSSLAGEQAGTAETRMSEARLPHPVIVTAQEYLWGGGGYDCSIQGSIAVQAPCRSIADALGLRWNGKEGEFCDRRGRVVAWDPSVGSPGPAALLIREGPLRRLLRRSNCEMVWTILGEKDILSPLGVSGPYLGRQEISGAMAIQGQSVVGRITSRFREFRSARS